MKRYLVILAALLFGAALLVSGCGGGDTAPPPDGEDEVVDASWDNVEEKGVFVMGLDDSFPPMGFREDGEIVGFDVDVAKEVCSRLGLELELQPINWDAKEQELNTGNIDCIWNGFTITPAREKEVLFSQPYTTNRQVLVVMEETDYADLADFEGARLGIQAGSSAQDALDDAEDFKAGLKEVIPFDDNVTVLMDLEKGGIDVALMDEVVARYYISMKDKGYRVLDEALASEEYGIGFRLGDQALMEKIQETIDAMAEDGTLAEISTKWFESDVTI